MFKNYLKIALRNLLKYKGYSLINIWGLALGIACCMLLILFIQHELRYDRHNEHAEDIYRIHTRCVIFGREILWTYTQEAFTKIIKEEFPEVRYSAHFDRARNVDLKINNEIVKDTNFFWANTAILNIFSFELLSGNKADMLTNPNSVIITGEIAEKYYRGVDPIGKTFYMDTTAYNITGVMKAQPSNSHFHANFIGSYNTFPENPEPHWFSFSTRTYVRLQEGVTQAAFAAKLPEFIERHYGERAREFGYQYEYIPMPLLDIHLHSNVRGELEPNGNILYVYIMSIIAAFILMIACINFMNLSTARASRRAKEVGMRKVMGAYKTRLIAQFLGESLLISTLAFLLAFGFVELVLPYFNELAGRDITLSLMDNPVLILAFLGIALIAGLGAGLYPAFYLTKFEPVQVLKNAIATVGATNRPPLLRQILVVTQFAISIALIIGTFIILDQLEYLRSKDLGFDKDHLVVVPLKGNAVQANFSALKNELSQNPDIMNVVGANQYPGGGFMTWDHWAEGFGDDEGISIDAGFVNYNYFEALQIPVVEGRAFAKTFATDMENAVMINTTAAKMLGFENDAVGKQLYTSPPSDTSRSGKEIIGVFQDFHAGSLREEIKPLLLYPRETVRNIIARVNAATLGKSLKFIEEKFQEVNLGAPFEYRFVDEVLAEYYESEQNLSAIINSFTFLAILIACLGLLGLISFTAEQKTKEIGIRKVLGATVSSIVVILSQEFAKLVIIANLIAWPLAYFAMDKWLQDFAYRTEIDPAIFIASGILALVIALATISFQAIKAALSNPIKALRSE